MPGRGERIPDEGAAAPEPSLVARIDAAEAPSDEAVRGLHDEHDENVAASTGRVEGEAATLGRHTGTRGSTASGAPVSSVGGAEGDEPGSGVADGPPREGTREPELRAGFLEGEGGRRGVSTSEGTLYADPGDRIRSAAEVAGGREKDRPDEAEAGH